MSPLAFDKQGKPFAFQRRTKKLLVRMFRNPSARGTCCQVLSDDGLALYIDPDTDYLEFRQAVGHVPGLYRLDQCDEDGNELDDAQPAYVSIDVARNAQRADTSSGDVNPLLIIQQMAAIQADVMKTMAANQAALLAATAEILRAPYRPAPIAAIATDLRNSTAASAEDDARDEEEAEEDEIEEPQPESTLLSVARMVDATMPNIAAQLGEFLYTKIFELMNKKEKKNATPTGYDATPPVVATAADQVATSPTSQASAVSFTSAPIAATGATRAAEVELPTPPRAPTAEDVPVGISAPTTNDVTSASTLASRPIPTPAQTAHLCAIRERLDPKDRAIAEAAIQRMTPAQLVHWLAELSAQSVEDATASIRELIAQIRQPSSEARKP
jgi:hypothetical protein